MCGIAGYIGKLDKVDAAQMLRAIDSRGGHAYGYAFWKAGEYSIFKNNDKVPKDVKVPESEQVLMHTRFATHGKPEIMANNHPFESREWILVHNGVVSNREKAQKTECDSESILKMLVCTTKKDKEHERVKKVVEKIEGSFRLGIINKDSMNMYIVSDKADPVYLEIGKEYVAFASEDWQLPCKSIRFRATDCSIYKITPTRKISQFEFKKKVVYYETKSWNSYNTYSGYSRGYSYKSDSATEIDKMPDTDVYTHEMRVEDTFDELSFHSKPQDRLDCIEECCEECTERQCELCPLFSEYWDAAAEKQEEDEEEEEEMPILQEEKEDIR